MTDENDETSGDFIQHAQDVAKNWSGEEMTPESMINEFALYGHAKRAAFLDNVDRQMKTPNDSNLRKLSDLVWLRGELSELHHKLRKAER
jgi:hypothetical protein